MEVLYLMNDFKESLKVKEQKEYEEYKRKRFEKVVQDPKWDIAKNRMKGDER